MFQQRYLFLFSVGLGAAIAVTACGDDATTGEDDNGGGGNATSTSTGLPSTASVTSSSTSGTGGGGNNIQCTPGENTNITGECDLLQQDVCVPPEGCEPMNGTTGCVLGGLKDVGMACANTNECVGGTACVFDVCAPFCCPDNDQPCAGGFCNVSIDYGSDKFAYVCSFPTTCTLFDGSECMDTENCHPNWQKGVATCIQPSGNGGTAEGGDCEFINDCSDMMTCSAGKCRFACDLANYASLTPGLGGCEADQTCAQVTGNIIAGVGVCAPM